MSIEVQQFLNDSGGNFTETAPRPPVPGEENELHSNGGTSTRSSGSYKSHLSAKSHTSGKSHRSDNSPAATPRRSNLDKTNISLSCSFPGVDGDEVNAPLGFEPEGSAANSPPFTENSSPPYLKWAENLVHLLDDSDGVKLFKQFLDQEQCAYTLDFWFACRGLKMVPEKDESKIHSLVKLIYRKYIKGDQLLLKPDIKRNLADRLSKKENINQSIFDEAQKEVEESMRNDTYPLFLKSDLYVQYVQMGGDSPKTSNTSSGSNSVRPMSGPLPTVQEGEELKREDIFKTPRGTLTLTESALMATRYSRISSNSHFKKPEGVYPQSQANRTHPNPYHVSYAPVSAQDSELQSLSSDALTDDTMSLTDSSVDGREAPPFGSKKWKQHRKAMHRNAQLNKCPELNQLNFIPRTDRAPKDRNVAETDPSKFATMLIERLDKVKDEQDKMKHLVEMMTTPEQMTDEEDLNKSSMSAHNKSVSMMELMATAIAEQEREDNAQSILEEHCSRIWESSAGQTPSRSPGRHSPERRDRDRSISGRRPIAGPSPNVSGIVFSKPHHKRTKDKDSSHLMSTLSFDSGMGEDKSGVYAHDENHHKHVHHYHHHHHASKDSKSSKILELEAQQQSMQYYRDSRLRDHHATTPRGWDDSALRGRSRDTKRSNTKKSLDASSNIDSGVSLRNEPTGNPTNEKVLAWMMENDKMHPGTTQYSTDSSEKSSSHKRSSNSHKSSSSGQGIGKKPVQYNASRSGSLDRSFHSLMPAEFVNHQGPLVLPAQPIIQDPSMPPLNPPNPTTQLEEAKRRLEDDCKAKHKSRSYMGTSKERRSMVPPFYPATPRPMTSTKGIPPTQALDLSRDAENSFRQDKRNPRRQSTSAPTTPAGDSTVVGYLFCGESIPYRSVVEGKQVTLRQFKQLITKRGSYRYFFKAASNEFGSDVILEEVTDDGAILPLWEGKVFGKVERIE